MKCSLLYRGLSASIWFLKIFTWFLGEAQVRVEKSLSTENLKMDIGQFFWQIYMDIIVKQCVKVQFGQMCSIWVCAK